jgi:hypothetical protein
MLKTIKNAIKDKLDTLKGSGQLLYEVHDFHKGEFGGFPAVTFEPSDVESDFENTAQNMRKYVFRIVIHQEIKTAGLDNSVDILADAVDAVINAFDSDYKLGNNVDWLEAAPADWNRYESPAGLVRTAEIRLVCNKSINI